ncbi:hypothetical protein AAHB33_17520 [Paenarthrobacter sp. S56]|uniref:hypothetical protein n=1 Tax=Paenarthrobacter sp. S56 TaxID=3138179 RepID=UPI003219CB2E
MLPNRAAAVVRCIMDSLAAGYARTLGDVERLTGRGLDQDVPSAVASTGPATTGL